MDGGEYIVLLLGDGASETKSSNTPTQHHYQQEQHHQQQHQHQQEHTSRQHATPTTSRHLSHLTINNTTTTAITVKKYTHLTQYTLMCVSP